MTDSTVNYKENKNIEEALENEKSMPVAKPRKQSFFIRVITEKVINPIRHATDHPDRVSRGVLIGTIVAVTPTFGIQMPIVFIIWFICRPFKKLDFNLPLGLTMTWLTNYFTILPYYFLLYLMGSFFMDIFWQIKSPMDYEQFTALWQPVLSAGFWDSFVLSGEILGKIGLRMILGALPFIVIVPPLLYWLTLRFQKKMSIS